MKNKSQIFHFDLQGKRETKYEFLNENSLSTIAWNKLEPNEPNFFFVKKDNEQLKSYHNNCFSLNDFFVLGANGIKTERDDLTIQFKEADLEKIKSDIIELEPEIFRTKYKLDKDGRDWKLSTAQKDLKTNPSFLTSVHYRPFDYRNTLYTGKSKGFHSYPRHNIHQHLINKNNISLILGRQGQAVGSMQWNLVFINKYLLDSNMFYRGGNMNFPLYLYIETNEQQTLWQTSERTPNLNTEIVKQIADKLSLTFTTEKETTKNTFAPIDILDYIYAVLHSPTYREKYKEFLKIDFPRVPYPKDKDTFWTLAKLGGELRQIHLLENPTVEKYITQYPIDGNNIVGKTKYQHGKVFINDTQYFDNVPQIAWDFFIGGYQPAQKWLKDRKERVLEFDDILHYQKIIVALTETDRLMKEIVQIEIE